MFCRWLWVLTRQKKLKISCKETRCDENNNSSILSASFKKVKRFDCSFSDQNYLLSPFLNLAFTCIMIFLYLFPQSLTLFQLGYYAPTIFHSLLVHLYYHRKKINSSKLQKRQHFRSVDFAIWRVNIEPQNTSKNLLKLNSGRKSSRRNQ